MRKYLLLVILSITINSFAQQSLSLNDCYVLVEKNYPLVAQNEFLQKQTNLDVAQIKTAKLPQFSVAAQATYQSDVIGLPLPNTEPLNKDQYKATITANQLIYGGHKINTLVETKKAQLKTNEQEIVVQLYQLKSQINQLYYSVLLNQEQQMILKSKKELLKSKLKEIQSGIKNGMLLPASDTVLEAELIKVHQQYISLLSNKKSLLATLSSLIKKEITEDVVLHNPEIKLSETAQLNRPELELYELKKQEIDAQYNVIKSDNSPKLIGFATGGYGNPGLNMLDNSFQDFYLVGLKLNWNVLDWKANKKKRESLAINKDIITTQAAIFTLNTKIELQKQQAEINRLSQIIKEDLEIIQLLKKVLKTSAAQLKNGVVTASAYLTELTKLFEAENTLAIHKIQLSLSKLNYQTTKGN